MSGDSSYNADKVSGMNSKLVMLMVALLIGVGWLNFTIANQQKFVQHVTVEAYKQYSRMQRIGMLLAQYMSMGEQASMDAFKKEASEAFAAEDQLAMWIQPFMPASAVEDSGKQKAHGLQAMHMVIQNAFTFAASPDSRDAADAVAKLASGDVPEYFPAEIGYFTAAKQKEIALYTNAAFALLGLMLAIALYQAYILFNPAMRYIVRLMEHIEHMAATDPLTGFYNRAMLFKVAGTLISGAKRHKHDLAVLAADIDNFKAINEAHGRASGDSAIKAVAAVLKEVLRTSDVVGRVAGQEFGIFLPSTDEYRAALVAEKLRAAVEDMPFSVKGAQVFLRISIGVAEMQGHHKNPDDILRAAETALARAKDEGRNRIVMQSGRTAADGPAPSAAADAAPPKAGQA